MSLFDRDSDVSSSHSSSSLDSDSEDTLPVRAPPVPGSNTYGSASASMSNKSTAAPLTALEQRRRMAEADASGRRLLHGGAQWRNELRPAPPLLNTVSATATSAAKGEESKFGSSIAAALSLRKDEKERMLLRRLQQQRKAEERGSDGKALAQKDLEVGVFVTASYKAVLQRNIHPAAAATAAGKETDAVRGEKKEKEDGDTEQKVAGGADDDDDDGPLGAYLRQLESQGQTSSVVKPPTAAAAAAAAAGRGGDYYDQVMKAPLEDEKRAGEAFVIRKGTESLPDEGTTRFTENEGPSRGSQSADAPFAPPSLSELQELIGGVNESAAPAPAPPSMTSAAPAEAETVEKRKDADAEADSAVLAHARVVYDMRVARQRRTANAATVQACAERCDERIASSLFC